MAVPRCDARVRVIPSRAQRESVTSMPYAQNSARFREAGPDPIVRHARMNRPAMAGCGARSRTVDGGWPVSTH